MLFEITHPETPLFPAFFTIPAPELSCMVFESITTFEISVIANSIPKNQPEVFVTKDGCITTKTYYMGERIYDKKCA